MKVRHFSSRIAHGLTTTHSAFRRFIFHSCAEYEKALRYLFVNPHLPDQNEAFVAEYFALRTPLQLNAALCALKTVPPIPDQAEALTTQVIERGARGGLGAPKEADLAKAHFRRALALSAMKRDDEA